MLAVLHNDPNASPPLEAAGFDVGLPRLAIELPELKDEVVPGVLVLCEKADAVDCPVVLGGVLISALTEVK